MWAKLSTQQCRSLFFIQKRCPVVLCCMYLSGAHHHFVLLPQAIVVCRHYLIYIYISIIVLLLTKSGINISVRLKKKKIRWTKNKPKSWASHHHY